ncbi:hypothetical protein BZA70DRAFT_252332 [Myxozyma melibiosi]|uniref:Uncharacterized protein n=1 Tax=Myxozyma melibiosi TaxID=54550 RepID=A0ABR1EXZ8_9ASCO
MWIGIEVVIGNNHRLVYVFIVYMSVVVFRMHLKLLCNGNLDKSCNNTPEMLHEDVWGQKQ